jgi:hypothetical protein
MSQYPNSASGAYGAYAAAGAGAVGATAAGAGMYSPTASSTDGFPGPAGDVRRGPSTGSTLTSAGYAGQSSSGAPILGEPMPVPIPTGTSSSHETSTPSTAASRKMREAQQERMRGMYAQNEAGPIPQTEPSSPGESDMVPRVHEDGGRFVPQGEEELPPQ